MFKIYCGKIAQNVQEFVSLVEECKDDCKDEKRKELLKKCAWENDWSVKAAELKAYMGEWEKMKDKISKLKIL